MAARALAKSGTDKRHLLRQSTIDARDDVDAARKGQFVENRHRGQHGGAFLSELAVMAEDGVGARAGVTRRRAQSPVDRYWARDEITSRQWEAARHLRDDYERGVIGLSSLEVVRPKVDRTYNMHTMSDGQMLALEHFNTAVKVLGPHAAAVVLPIVIGRADGSDVTVKTLAAQLGQDPRRLFGAFALGLDQLANHYRLK